MKIFEDLTTKDKQLFAPTLFFPEVVGTIRRKTDSSHFAQIIEETVLRWIKNFIEVKELTKLRMQNSVEDAILYGLKGADAVSVALAKELKAELLTFDDKMKGKIKGKVKLYKMKL